MNNIWVKKSLTIIMMYLMFVGISKVYGITDNFKFVIDTIGIPRYNVYGKEINEEIYKAYNVFSYGWPEELGSNVGQRWKNSKYGLWSKGKGAYNGSGTRGEYNLLGRDYSGNIINNYYFPVDTLPETIPEYWSYYSNPGAKESWNDKGKYKYIEQLEFMKNTKLIFNDISSRDNSDNPEKMKEYNITANKIGLDKARLDVCSTWKTNGIIHTRRKINGRMRYAVFLTKPMSANANIKSSIEVDNSYILKATDDEINIDISYGSNIVKMTGYAKDTHIKEIVSKLYINGKEMDSISGSKIDNVGKKYTLTLSRENLKENQNNQIMITNNSYAHTEFAVDGLMQDSINVKINIFVEKEEIVPYKLNDIKILEKQEDALVVRPLAQSKTSNGNDSLGITEAGKYIVMKLALHKKVSTDDINILKVYLDEEEIKEYEILDSKSGKYLILKFKIPTYTSASIYGWKSLRETYGNYFGINEKDIGKRISKPHEIDIKCVYQEREHVSSFEIDTIDDYISNINYTYINSSLDTELIKLENWLE